MIRGTVVRPISHHTFEVSMDSRPIQEYGLNVNGVCILRDGLSVTIPVCMIPEVIKVLSTYVDELRI